MPNSSAILTRPFADYPHIKKVGDLYFLAGQGCRDPETNAYAGLELDSDGGIKGYNIADQTRGVILNMERALKSVGLGLEMLIDVTVFLKTMDDFPQMNEVWNVTFKGKSSPTRTTVAVADLPGHNFVEMKGIASAIANTNH